MIDALGDIAARSIVIMLTLVLMAAPWAATYALYYDRKHALWRDRNFGTFPGVPMTDFFRACLWAAWKFLLVLVQIFCWISPTFQVYPEFTSWPMVIVTSMAAGVVIFLSGTMLLGFTSKAKSRPTPGPDAESGGEV